MDAARRFVGFLLAEPGEGQPPPGPPPAWFRFMFYAWRARADRSTNGGFVTGLLSRYNPDDETDEAPAIESVPTTIVYVKSGDAATRLGVETQTIRNWNRNGQKATHVNLSTAIYGARIGGGGQLMVPETEVQRLLIRRAR